MKSQHISRIITEAPATEFRYSAKYETGFTKIRAVVATNKDIDATARTLRELGVEVDTPVGPSHYGPSTTLEIRTSKYTRVKYGGRYNAKLPAYLVVGENGRVYTTKQIESTRAEYESAAKAERDRLAAYEAKQQAGRTRDAEVLRSVRALMEDAEIGKASAFRPGHFTIATETLAKLVELAQK